MRKKQIMLFLLVILGILLLTSPQARGEILFEEDFSTNLDNWYLVVYNNPSGSENAPPPVIDNSMGQPAPSLNPNGDGWCGNGAYSKQTFDYASGLKISWDMLVSAGYDWNWGMLGISDHLPNLSNPRADGVYIDNNLCDPRYVVNVSFVDDAQYNQDDPYLSFSLTAEDGMLEGLTIKPATEFCNVWHHYEIEITLDGYVIFYMDGEVMFQSTKRIKGNLGALPVLIGDRCYDAPVRIDNVVVSTIELPDDDTDDDDAADDDVIDDDATDDDVIDDDAADDDDNEREAESVGGCGC